MARGNSVVVGYLMRSGQFILPVSKQPRGEVCGSMIVGGIFISVRKVAGQEYASAKIILPQKFRSSYVFRVVP